MPYPKPTPVGPLTGVLDLRSSPEELPRDAMRMRQDLRTVGQGKLRRGNGYEKLLNTADYNNADFHDQLLALSSASIRQPLTLLYEAISTRKIRSLIVGTQGTVAQLNSHTGNYRILGSGFGGTPSTSANAPRFHCDRLGDYVVFTNDYDKVQYMVLEAAPDAGEFLLPIPDLDTIGLRRAKRVWVWHNTVFLANVEMDGERAAYRLVWSDFDNALGFDPADPQSVTGTKDLYTHEEILAGEPFGNSFLIYTTHGIWEMIVVGGEQSFDFRRVYDGERDELKGVLAYPNTLVNVHDGHAYVGHDGIYFMSQYQPAPTRPEWLHRGSADMLDSIDESSCQAHVAAVYGDDIIFSVTRTGATNQCPDYTLRVNKTYQACDVVGGPGFTALCQYSPQDVETVRDFIVQNNLCTLAGLNSAGYGYGPEGLPRILPTALAAFTPDHFYTTVTQAVPDGKGGTVTMEDWNQSSASAHSLCTLLAGARLDELCQACKVKPILVGASSGDWCLKQLTDVFYREDCLNTSAVGVSDSNGYTASTGSYVLNPITSILRFASVFIMDSQVQLDQLEIKFLAAFQASPLSVSLRVGVSAQPADANTGEGIVWFQHSSQPLKFASLKTMAEHLAGNTVPAERAHWHVWRVGRFIHIELTIAGVGGDALFGSIEAVLLNAGTTNNF